MKNLQDGISQKPTEAEFEKAVDLTLPRAGYPTVPESWGSLASVFLLFDSKFGKNRL